MIGATTLDPVIASTLYESKNKADHQTRHLGHNFAPIIVFAKYVHLYRKRSLISAGWCIVMSKSEENIESAVPQFFFVDLIRPDDS